MEGSELEHVYCEGGMVAVKARDEEKQIGWSGPGFRKWEGRKTRRYGERSWSAYAVGWTWLRAKAETEVVK